MKNKKQGINKKKIIRTVALVAIIVVAIYILYTIFSLIKHPTNVFVVENGILTMEEEAVRLYNKR